MSTAATSIQITFSAAGCSTYLDQVTDLIIGNMVAPGTNTNWSRIPPNPNEPTSNTWTWVNEGQGTQAFGLMGNYKYNGVEATALDMVVIDPGKLEAGNYQVEVVLYTAEIGPGNNILKFRSATINGNPAAAYLDTWPGQPSAEFYDC